MNASRCIQLLKIKSNIVKSALAVFVLGPLVGGVDVSGKVEKYVTLGVSRPESKTLALPFGYLTKGDLTTRSLSFSI